MRVLQEVHGENGIETHAYFAAFLKSINSILMKELMENVSSYEKTLHGISKVMHQRKDLSVHSSTYFLKSLRVHN